MTDIKVVDTSAIAALLFGETEGEMIGRTLQGSRLVAPALLDFELANVCRTKCRREPERLDILGHQFALRHLLGIESRTVDHDAALRLAIETGLTVYDASYLWLSLQEGADLVTLDRKLGGVWTALRL